MLIRHGEKHTAGDHAHGLTADGRPARHELTLRGWQRAAALVSHFAPADGHPLDSPVQTPRSIFASNATKDSPSKRAMHTAGPLAEMLGVAVNHDFAEDEEAAIAKAALAAPSPVLIVWHHGKLPALARSIAGNQIDVPAHWPDERFDVTWVLDGNKIRTGRWTFTPVAQRLLPGDSTTLF